MIFHTACNLDYYNEYYLRFFNSIKKYCKYAKFSLRYVGDPTAEIISFCKENDVLLTIDQQSITDISNRFNQPDINECYGYYAISRWCSIPETADNVFVCDVDFFAINDIDVNEIEKNLNEYDVVNITRVKPDGIHGGMASIVLTPKVCKLVNNAAKDILNNNQLRWDLDVLVKTFIYKNVKYFELNGKVLDVSKKSYNRDFLTEWFVLSKGGREVGIKINRINRFLENNNREIL